MKRCHTTTTCIAAFCTAALAAAPAGGRGAGSFEVMGDLSGGEFMSFRPAG